MNRPLRTLALVIEYEGSAYCGWQRQPNVLTAQAVVETAVSRILDSPHTLLAASRLDSGAHALDLVVSLRTVHEMDRTTLQRAVNAVLPADIRIRQILETPPGWHPQKSKQTKTYLYAVLMGAEAPAFSHHLLWREPRELDLAAMEQAARHLLGRHDFSAFRGKNATPGDPAKRIYESRWIRSEALLGYVVRADAFLKQMVRNLVGTMVEIGRGQREVDSPAKLLAGGMRVQAGVCAPAQGLYLLQTAYEPELEGHVPVPRFCLPGPVRELMSADEWRVWRD